MAFEVGTLTIGEIELTVTGIGDGVQTFIFNQYNEGELYSMTPNSPTDLSVYVINPLGGYYLQFNTQPIEGTGDVMNHVFSFNNNVAGRGNVAPWTNRISTDPNNPSYVALLGSDDNLYIVSTPANTATKYTLTFDSNGIIIGVGDINADICVRAGALVLADQGYVLIEQLDPQKHTLNGGQRIVAVTKTKAVDEKHLVLFRAHAMGFNVPACDTYLSLGHKVYGVEAEVWATRNKLSIMLMDRYSDEYLYNVLLETYGVMKVNNMVIETLDPSNPIAKLYL